MVGGAKIEITPCVLEVFFQNHIEATLFLECGASNQQLYDMYGFYQRFLDGERAITSVFKDGLELALTYGLENIEKGSGNDTARSFQ
ncbi:hypothetical protein [Photobacterium ganghwense]|uniref:hypothetical protein n=1 Tax=Photobacterium ganghwense TaxID=320778 RepID=UPI001A8CEF33|nr:hypothetical protein [Photobacterium ganghwense]QSV17650.1 hypothetical protein FH974_25530 [Photobacterium ganghwense]